MNDETQQMTESGTYKSLPIEEYNRLKRLDENINREIRFCEMAIGSINTELAKEFVLAHKHYKDVLKRRLEDKQLLERL